MRANLDAMGESLALLRQSADLRQELYRVYFLEAQNDIMAAEFFSAPGDRAAAQVAALVHDASSDVSRGYETRTTGIIMAYSVDVRGQDQSPAFCGWSSP